MHGLGISSSDFVVSGPNASLAFLLCEKGFDVWIGNARGNKYSKAHKIYSPKSLEFWNFTWHEISILDLPAMIDYITEVTGQKQVRYFGHSQGTTNYLVLNSMMPEWNDRFKSAHLMAPVAYINNAKNAFLNLVAPLVGQPNALREVLGSFEFKPSKETALVLKALMCNGSLPEQAKILCENSLFLSTEFNEDTVDYDLIPDIMATTPTSLSANQYLHFFQEFKSGYFRQFDYGFARNLIKYGSFSPPNYELKNIKGPVFLYYGKSDKFVSRIDFDRLIEQLPNSTLAGLYVVPVENFDHLAFLYTKNVREKLYNQASIN
ncbi:lipase 3-like [Eupeodes corollae]|uniref:lipase 3-like n=1 Tax=Eupeodes corollae TaxID=290404 RepID=UPI002491EA9D|nr:lipase 3-like [Eupeodes corollae]